MKKSRITQELVNVYPPESKVRSDDQSIGYQVLNVLAQPLERAEKQLITMQANQYLTTANIDEVDLTHRVELPATFEFDLDNLDPTASQPIPPTVSGFLINDQTSGYVPVTLAKLNDLETFWYDSVPNRLTVDDPITGVSDLLYSGDTSDFPASGEFPHHLGGGKVWIETEGGVSYIKTNEKGELDRGQIILRGTTRKGTEESETIIFPWDQKQASLKEWETIKKVETYNIEDGVNIFVRSADFDHGPYMDFWNMSYSSNRNKVDEFWDVNTSKLERIRYISDEWQQLLLGFSDKEAVEKWDLLDSAGATVTPVDMKVQPFTDRAWVVTADGMLYCYDLEQNMASGIDDLEGKTAGSEVRIEIQNRRLVSNDEIRFAPWHARPIQEIARWRIWVKKPDGVKAGIKNGVEVSFASDFWNNGSTTIQRNIADDIVLTASQYGEYLLVMEAEMADGTTHVDRVIVQVQQKRPLTTLDAGYKVLDPVVGIDFDSDQQMWLKTSTNKFYKVNLHTDIMLVDYTSKILYFKEDYANIKVVD